MNPIIKLIIGSVTIIPLLYIPIFMINLSNRRIDFDLMFNLHIATMVWVIGLIIYYISHIFRTEAMSSDKKSLWAIVIFMGHVIAMPIYWYLYLWQEPK